MKDASYGASFFLFSHRFLVFLGRTALELCSLATEGTQETTDSTDFFSSKNHADNLLGR